MGGPHDLLRSRRSVGKVSTDPVARSVVDDLLTAATMAPNHHLTEPWRFVVLTGAARRRVGEAHAAAVERSRGAPLSGEQHAREAARLERAPVVIVCAVRTDPSDQVRAREDRDAVAAAVQNLLLAAHASGLGAIWRTGTMVDEPEVREALGLAGEDAVVGFVYVGHPVGPPPVRPRASLDAVVRWCER